ncbi:small-conductance mechanosensitive channel [Palleronia aestuarii]|uniref:Small-conductance mechanosensitive channel n=1 Tax=Palleronia aestuarii TaxID=568105 RepID=A0A2W7NKC8_9RHOB|nr:DUF3772 domain-containing protein [Palleronia aestuarii]PZX13646.1 small-conductance mechanosensitive channel [Palleronia aestuarii]
MIRPACRGGLVAGLIALWLLFAAGLAAAQEAERPDYQRFQSFAGEVADTLDGNVGSGELEALRSRLAEWRATFLTAQDTNSSRIATIESQIEALGPVPGEGAPPESADVAQRREALNEQLRTLRAPVVAAEEAYRLADGLVVEIDRTIRDRYTRQLLARDASPLNPTYWPTAIDALDEVRQAVVSELQTAWSSPDRSRRAIDAMAVAIPLAIIGLLLMFRSRWWIRLLERWAVTHSPRGRGVLAFTLSLGQVILPFLGVALLVVALTLPGLAGQQTLTLINAIPYIAAPIILSKWLAQVVFPSEPDDAGPLELWESTRNSLRFYGTMMGFIVAVILAERAASEVIGRADTAIAVLLFLPRIALAFVTYRVGRTLMRIGVAQDEEEDKRGLSGPFLRGLGRLAIVAAVAGAAAAALGYTNAAEFLLLPTVMTLGISALLLLLQRFVYDLYALMTGTPEGETDALAPVLIGFALVLAALPLYALVWGARVADLTEIWSRFRTGFAIGETRIAPSDFIAFLVIFAVGYALTRFVQRTLRNSILPKTRLDVGGRNAISAGVGYIGIFLAVMIAISSAGINLQNIALVAGALSVGIGFGLQNVVSNFVSGIILLIERPISEGDWIEVGGQMGYVRDISVRSTRIETFDRTDVIVPNADLVSNSVTNWTRGNLVGRVIVPVTVAYGTDTAHVDRLLREIAEANPMVVLNPPPAIYFRAMGENGMMFEIRAILRDVNFILEIQSELNHAIAVRFADEGIRIPLPQRDLWLRGTPSDPGGPVAAQTSAGPRAMQADGDAGDGW